MTRPRAKKGTTTTTRKAKKKIEGMYRSKFEARVHKALGMELQYESKVLLYMLPVTNHKYTPDFYDEVNDIYYEAKGKLDRATRKKMIAVRDCNPTARIVFVFQKPYNPIYKGSKTTYADWAEKEGFEWIAIP
jgi:hypothetical protein